MQLRDQVNLKLMLRVLELEGLKEMEWIAPEEMVVL